MEKQAEARATILPFAPGNIVSDELTELRRLVASMPGGGESAEIARTEIARRVARLSEGFENRLPALHHER